MSPRNETRLVYRVEHGTASWRHDGYPDDVYQSALRPGPWSCEVEPNFYLYANTMHTPYQDGIKDGSMGRAHGVRTLANIWQWFGPNAAHLHAQGWVIGIYEVPEWACEHGEQQVVFEPALASRVDTLTLPDARPGHTRSRRVRQGV